MQQLRTFLDGTEAFFALIRGDDLEETEVHDIDVEENRSAAAAKVPLEDSPVEAVMLELETAPVTSVQVLGAATIETTLAANEANSDSHHPFQKIALPTPAVNVNQERRNPTRLSRSWSRGFFRGFLRHRYHLVGFLAMIGQLGFVVVGMMVDEFPVLSFSLLLLGVFFPIFMVISIYCAASSNLYPFLSNPREVIKASDYFDHIPNLRMHLVHHAHCYHQVSSDSRESVSTTHFAEREFIYTSSIDITEYPEVSNISLCVVHFSSSYQFSDDTTRGLFELSKARFEADHRSCDSEREFWTDFKIEGLHNQILSFEGEDDIPDVIRNGMICHFNLLTLLCGISWFYYVWFDGIIEERNVEVKRVVV